MPLVWSKAYHTTTNPIYFTGVEAETICEATASITNAYEPF